MPFDIHVYHYFKLDPEVLAKLELLSQRTDLIIQNQEIIMPTLEELKAKADANLASVTAETDIDNAVAKIVTDQRQTIIDLKAQLDAAIAANDPAKLQAVSDTMDQILTLNTSNTKIVADAVTAGTPV